MVDSLLLCIDGGGSKTQAAICDRGGRVQNLVTGQGCNPQDNAKWAANLEGVIETALHEFGQPEYSIVGMPGYAEVSTIDQEIGALVSNVFGENCLIMNDVELACRSAFPDRAGVLLLAGTGSMAMQTTSKGLSRVGGWGDLIGDEGSGYWIGRRALQCLSHAMDGREEPDAFTRSIAQFIDVTAATNATDLLGWMHGLQHPRSQIAALASEIDRMALAGEPRAVKALKDAATALANLVTTAHGNQPGPLVWACAGSALKSQILRKEITRILGCDPTEPTFDILSGGLWLAAILAKWNPDADFADNLKSTMKTKKDAA